MAAVGSETFTSTSAPIQHAAVRAFEGGPEIDDYLDHCRRILRTLGNVLTRRLRRSGSDVLRPHGGFYLFPDFSPLSEKLRARGICTSAEMCERLLTETGVAVLPGSDFGRPPEELTFRLAYVDFDGTKALAASRSVETTQCLNADFVGEHCGRVVQAVNRMCDWLQRRE